MIVVFISRLHKNRCWFYRYDLVCGSRKTNMLLGVMRCSIVGFENDQAGWNQVIAFILFDSNMIKIVSSVDIFVDVYEYYYNFRPFIYQKNLTRMAKIVNMIVREGGRLNDHDKVNLDVIPTCFLGRVCPSSKSAKTEMR